MVSSPFKALWDRLRPEQKKEMDVVAAGWQADRQSKADGVPMKDATDEESAPPSSSTRSSSMHCIMTIGEVCAHFMDMVGNEREEQFREAHVDVGYNLHLLEKHWQVEQQLNNSRVELEPAFNEFDEVAVEVWCKSDDKEDIVGSVKATPRRHDHEVVTFADATGSKEE
ncbi:Sulfotransferase [Hordeum vulgare]|nr:Sulfotransferase [Hordeum vulgare]